MYVARRPVCLLRRIFFSTFFAPPLRFVVLLLLVLLLLSLFSILRYTFTFYLIIYTLGNEFDVRLSLFIALIMHILRQLATFMPEIAVLLAKQ